MLAYPNYILKAGTLTALTKRYKTSQTWLNRHVRDQYVKKSIQDDLRSRSSYKLKEIQEKYNIITSPSNYIIDMGAAPGGWSIIASNCLNGKGLLIAIDLLPIVPIPNINNNIHILQGNMFDPNIESEIQTIASNHYLELSSTKESVQQPQESNTVLTTSLLSTNPNQTVSNIHLADVILSDMMVNMCGNKETDHYRSMDLCYNALNFSKKYLKRSGNFVCKYFRGSDEKEFLDELKLLFQQVKLVKPDASRKESNEMYVIAIRKK